MSIPRYGYAALYGAALLVFVDQAVELVMSLYPARLAEVQWRFGAFGLVVGRATTAVLLDVLVFLAAVGLGHRVLLRIWGVAHLVVAICLLAGLGWFGLDTLEIRRTVRPESESAVLLAAAKAAAVVLLGTVYCVWLGLGALRSARGGPPRGGPAEEVLVVVSRAG